ncbi:MAG: hypothetical protein AB2L14_30810 [Candidatus Xenobiia bacterium LiM19]
MKKKYRYRKRSVPGISAPGSDDALKEEGAEEESEPQEQQESAVTEPAVRLEKNLPAHSATPGKLEVVLGMGLLGLVTGFLSGYGNMELAPALFYSIVGMGAGILLGNIPYLSLKG